MKKGALYLGILGFDERSVFEQFFLHYRHSQHRGSHFVRKWGVILLVERERGVLDLLSTHYISYSSSVCRPKVHITSLWGSAPYIIVVGVGGYSLSLASLYCGSCNFSYYVVITIYSNYIVYDFSLAPSLTLPPDATARKWLGQTKAEVMHQLQVTTIHLLSPFLYGCSHQTDKVSTYTYTATTTNYRCSLHIATCVPWKLSIPDTNGTEYSVHIRYRCPQWSMNCPWGKKRCPYWRVVLISGPFIEPKYA